MKGSAAGGQAADYANGVLVTSYPKNILGTYEASVKAMTDMGMTIRSSDKAPDRGFIEATRPDDMELVAVTFRAQGPDATTAVIKVGANGDEPYSRVVAKRIEARLRG